VLGESAETAVRRGQPGRRRARDSVVHARIDQIVSWCEMCRGRLARAGSAQPIGVGTTAGSLTSWPGRSTSGRAARGQHKSIPDDLHHLSLV